MGFTLDVYSVLFYAITLLWILEFVFFPSKNGNGERKSFYIISGSIIAIISITIISYQKDILIVSIYPISTYLRIIALLTYFVGIVLKYWSSICLGEYFNRNVVVKVNQRLVSTGPYAKLRHPLYLSLFMLTTSVPLFYLNITAFFLAALLMGYVLNGRMKIEEKAMEDVIGENYIKWKNERYRFLPFIY